MITSRTLSKQCNLINSDSWEEQWNITAGTWRFTALIYAYVSSSIVSVSYDQISLQDARGTGPTIHIKVLNQGHSHSD